MTVKELIEFLQTMPQDLQVCYGLYSEQCLLNADDLLIREFQPPRNDGWVHAARPDKPKQSYLLFPGN